MHYSPRKSSRLLCGLALAALLGAFSAQAAEITDRALVVIRFNQPRVYYDQQLYTAISKAVAVKPSVTFAVVSFAPATGNAQADARWQQAASAHTQAVVASLQQMGVPLSRLQVSGQFVEGLSADEVHILAQ